MIKIDSVRQTTVCSRIMINELVQSRQLFNALIPRWPTVSHVAFRSFGHVMTALYGKHSLYECQHGIIIVNFIDIND